MLLEANYFKLFKDIQISNSSWTQCKSTTQKPSNRYPFDDNSHVSDYGDPKGVYQKSKDLSTL